MFGEEIFKRASSLSAALSVLLSANNSQASVPSSSTPKLEDFSEPPFEPILLKSAAPQEMSDLQFAGHRSHSSHSSHYSGSSSGHSSHSSHASHYSSSSGGSYNVIPSAPSSRPYVPAATPTPIPTPVYVPRAVTVSPSYVAPTPTPVRRTAPNIPISKVEFKNGAVFIGHVLVKSGAGITLQTQDGTVHKVPRRLLTDATAKALELPPAS
jgi:hypothetical protein